MLLVPSVIAVGLRVFVLPRQTVPGKTLVPFILGLAMTECRAIIGTLLLPADGDLLYTAAAIVWLLYVPLFVRTDRNPRAVSDPGCRCIFNTE